MAWSKWEEIDAFENEVIKIVDRFHQEFDIPTAAIEGVLNQVGRRFADEQEGKCSFDIEIKEEEDNEDPEFLG